MHAFCFFLSSSYLAEELGELSLVVRLRGHLLAAAAEHPTDLRLVLLRMITS